MTLQLDETIARKVLKTVDAGLSGGLGNRVPGQMCVEAAVCFAYGLPHGDNPPCVGSAVRAFKIALNDSRWSSNAARTAGMRGLAIAQLGSDAIDQVAFAKLISEGMIRRVVPVALRAAASLADEPHKSALTAAAERCEKEGTEESARYAAATTATAADATATAAADAARYAADAAATTAADAAVAAVAARYAADAAARYAADAAATTTAAAARDNVLNIAADVGLQALIALKSPGCEYLWLLDERRAE